MQPMSLPLMSPKRNTRQNKFQKRFLIMSLLLKLLLKSQWRASNQIKSFLLSHHVCFGEWNSWERAPDSAETIYIWTVHTYRLIQKTMCRIHLHILSTHSVRFKTYLQLSIHVIHRMYTFYIMYTYIHTIVCKKKSCSRLYIGRIRNVMDVHCIVSSGSR